MEQKPLKIVYITPALYIAGGIERTLTFKANYFSEQLGFSNTVSEGLSSTYCLNYSSLENEDLNFTLSPLNPLGISSNPLTFSFEQNCQSSQCTTQENQQYKRIINQIKTLKVFIKTRITNPLNMDNPIQTQVNTFTLTKSPGINVISSFLKVALKSIVPVAVEILLSQKS